MLLHFSLGYLAAHKLIGGGRKIYLFDGVGDPCFLSVVGEQSEAIIAFSLDFYQLRDKIFFAQTFSPNALKSTGAFDQPANAPGLTSRHCMQCTVKMSAAFCHNFPLQ